MSIIVDLLTQTSLLLENKPQTDRIFETNFTNHYQKYFKKLLTCRPLFIVAVSIMAFCGYL